MALQPEIKTTSLDTMIREKAKLQAEKDFWTTLQPILSQGHSGTWTPNFTYEDFQDLRRLLEKFMHGIYIPVHKQKAVDVFFETYKRLQVEFPNFGEEAS